MSVSKSKPGRPPCIKVDQLTEKLVKLFQDHLHQLIKMQPARTKKTNHIFAYPLDDDKMMDGLRPLVPMLWEMASIDPLFRLTAKEQMQALSNCRVDYNWATTCISSPLIFIMFFVT